MIKVAVGLVVVIGLVVIGYCTRLKREQPDAPVLETLRRRLESRTFEAFYEYGRAHAASANFQRRYFGESGRSRDHFRLVAYLDVSLLPTLQRGMRLGTKAQRERWIEAQARWLAGYWENLSGEERALVREALGSPEGQRLVAGSARFYLGKLTTSEQQELQPLVGQLTTILNQVEQSDG